MITRQRSRHRRPSRGWSNHNVSQASSNRMRWQNRSRQDAIETRQRTANAANRDARIELKPEEQVESPEEIMLKKLGLNTDMISGDYLYLKDINEFEDIQMYATVLEGSKPSHTYDDYEKQIERYLLPFADLIAPGAVKPYCLQYDEISKNDKCHNSACSYNYNEMLNNSDELFPTINWLPVCKAAQLPVEACQEFWWSFDITHIKDGKNGYFVPTQKKHYSQIDEKYYDDLEQRVRCLGLIFKEKEEESSLL